MQRGPCRADRRRFLGALGAAMGSAALPRWAHGADSGPPAALAANGDRAYRLEVTRTTANIDGRPGGAILVNGQLPGPLLRWREGERVTLQVTNRLSEPTSIHWHGLLLPAQMDGVPGVSFPGIAPGETFHYSFDVRQAGTYWYHSHSGLQEQLGHYGPIVTTPAEPDPVVFHREHVIVLSDWTFEDPHRLAAQLKKQSDVYNYQQRTVGDFLLDVRNRGPGGAGTTACLTPRSWSGSRVSGSGCDASTALVKRRRATV